jgi:enterochelin esterase-like enzyme
MTTRARITPPAAAGLLGSVAGLALVGCVAHAELPIPSPAPAPVAAIPHPAEELTWSWPDTPVGPMTVVVSVPARLGDERFPVLVALHGLGEAKKGPDLGARGWIDDYWLPRAIDRLAHPPLTVDDLQGFADPARLGVLDTDLARAPYRGLVVVCAYTPTLLAKDDAFTTSATYARFLVGEVLPRVRREAPALAGATATGIDGVSLGGRAALLVGLAEPGTFGAIGTLQAAFGKQDGPELARRAVEARKVNPGLSIRLVTSSDDHFLEANRAIDRAMTAAGVPHRLVEVPGPHDYPFNRGPGVYEMLLFHDRVLRGELPPGG